LTIEYPLWYSICIHEKRGEVVGQMNPVVLQFTHWKAGKSTLKEMWEHIECSASLSLNVIDKDGNLVISNTVVFCHFEIDEQNPKMLVAKNQWSQVFISLDALDKYVLEWHKEHIQYVFHYHM
jgi:hypothetical protein